jgi:hypothetical protein
MRKLIAVAAAAALAAPAAVAVAQPKGTAPTTPTHGCKQLRHDMGTSAFRQAYGTNRNHANAMGKCRSAEAKALKSDARGARKACATERAADPAAFAKKYGTGKKGRNAFGKCVSSTTGRNTADRHDAVVNAARRCRKERADDPAGFKDTYGTGKRKANAFGRCVAKTARAKS